MDLKKIERGQVFKVLLFLLFNLLFIALAGATLTTEVNSFKIERGNFENIAQSTDLEIVYHTSLGDSYIAEKIGNKFYFNPESEVYCWEGCNIYPKFTIYSKEIKTENEILALQELNFQSGFKGDLYDLFGIYQEMKYIQHLDTPEIIGKTIDPKESETLSEGDYLVRWDGEIIIQERGFYEFNLSALGDSKVIVNEAVVLDSSEGLHKAVHLDGGTYPLNISFRHNINNGNPNLFWNLNGKEEIVPEKNLIFIRGVVQKTSEGGRKGLVDSIPEPYSPNYSLYPSATLYIPSSLEDVRPLILVHGLNGKYPYWNQLPERLTSLDNDVWQFYYADANVSNFMVSGLLKWGVDTALSYYSDSAKANIVAHSMGTLVTLGYIDNFGKDRYGNQISYNGKIGNVVLVGGPIHGSYLANRVLREESAGIVCGHFIDPDDPEAQAYLDLAFGSEFTWLLNQKGMNSNIRYLTVVGSEGIPCLPDETYQEGSEPGSGNDGFLAVASGSLLDKGVDLVVFTGDNHANLIGQRELCGDSINCFGQCQYFPFMCHTSQKIDREVNVINGFFRSYSENTLRNYLMSEDYYIKPNDTSNPYSRGSVVLKIVSLQAVSEVKLKKRNTDIFYTLTKYHDDVHFTQIDNWFYYSNNDPNMANNNSLYGITFSKGTYDVYINGRDTGQDIEIKGAQTTMQEILLDFCNPVNDCCDSSGHIIPLGEQPDNPLLFDGVRCVGKNRTYIDYDCTGLEYLTGDGRTDTWIETCGDDEICAPDACLLNISCTSNVTNTTWGPWQNISCLPNDKMNQTMNKTQHDANNCGLFQNTTFSEYKQTEFCDFCTPHLVNTTWSNWTNSGQCTIQDIQNQSRFRTQYDINNCGEVQNQTFYEYSTLNCNYCSQNIEGLFYTPWSECSNGERSRVRYFVDDNYGSCCAITGLLTDCSINNMTYQNVTETSTEGCGEPNQSSPGYILVNSPQIDITNNRKIQIDILSSVQLSKLESLDNSQTKPRWSTLCRNCNSYNRSKTFSNGNHELVFRGIALDGQELINQTFFLLDYADPKISTARPKNRAYTNGSDFYVKYTEDNCENVRVLLDGLERDAGACESGRNVEKYLMQDLNSFDGSDVEYQFIISDVAGNLDQSRATKIKVDTTAPEITKFNVSVKGKDAYFNLTINEINFASVKYLDNSESKPRWNTLCSNLKKEICFKKIRFKTGSHDLIIRSFDFAGNSAQRQININIS